jgi:hypothetical protein
MKRTLEAIVSMYEGVEYIVLPLLLVAIGPFVWFYWLASAHRTAWALTVALSWLASIGIVGYEVRRKAITAVSLFVFLVWLIVLMNVFESRFA